MENLMQLTMDEVAAELVPISRKLYDHSSANCFLVQELNRLSGAYIEAVCNDTQRRNAFTVANPYGNGFEAIRASPRQQGNQRQKKGRRKYFLRVSGTKGQIDLVRNVIANILNNANNGDRAKMKIDVSFAEHSFIIGRKGKNIETVMRATGTHVHFPDSNRNNQVEKSNQVSVAGAPDQVLEARRRIRYMLPVSFVFLVDKADYARIARQDDGDERAILEKLKREFEPLQNEYRMTINWLPVWDKCAMVTVRGRRSNFRRIRDGLFRLMDFLQPNKKRPVVYLGLEVSPHYLSYVLGPKDIKIRYLEEVTNSRFQVISTRSERAYHMPTIRIFGEIDNVFEAWSGVMDLLPATLLVDVPAVPQSWHDAVYNEELANGTMVNAIDDSGIADSSDGNPQLLLDRSYEYCLPSDVLRELGEFQVVSRESLETVLTSAKENDNYDAVVTAMRTTMKLVTKINSLVYDYDISLLLRLNRDSCQWKIVARGPEGFVDLLMDIYRALSNPNVNPLAFIRDALKRASPPIRFADRIGLTGPSRPPNPPIELMHDMSMPSVISRGGSGSVFETIRSSPCQSEHYPISQRSPSSSVGVAAGGTDNNTEKRHISGIQTPSSPPSSVRAKYFGGYDLSEGTCSASTPTSPGGSETTGWFGNVGNLEHDNLAEEHSVFGSLGISRYQNAPRPWPRSSSASPPQQSPAMQVSMNQSGFSTDMWDTSDSTSDCSPIKREISPRTKRTASFNDVDRAGSRCVTDEPSGDCHEFTLKALSALRRETASKSSTHWDPLDRGCSALVQPDEELIATLSKLNTADDKQNKNIANLAPGAGRHLFRSGLV